MTNSPAAHNIEILYSEEELNSKIAKIAKEISAKYRHETVYMFCILNGAAHFFSSLTSKITDVDVIEKYMRTSSYGANTVSSGKVEVEVTFDAGTNIKDKPIIIVEDIIDSGHTMETLVQIFRRMSPKSIEVCTMLDKPSRREVNDFPIDYCGFTVDDVFIVGYGLDYDQRYRNLPYIGYIPQ